jgi:hypothetical protein
MPPCPSADTAWSCSPSSVRADPRTDGRSEMIRFALASLVCLAASLAQAAGFQRIEIPANSALSPPLKGAVWYPCAKPPGEMKIGRYVLTVTEDCPMAGGKLPLVVISHGRGGDFLGHHDTAEAPVLALPTALAYWHRGALRARCQKCQEITVLAGLCVTDVVCFHASQGRSGINAIW